MPGTLFIVATPIGNLEDVTFRALRTLREVDVIAAEDTRRTRKLLSYYDIHRPLVSVREHNEARESGRLLARLKAGESVALVSDAGTPGIADPGARFVAAARSSGVRVVPIPGPSAVTAALSASGFPAETFVFLGFPPSGGAAREEWLSSVADESRTCVVFEAPHRLKRTLADLEMVKRPISIFREITKIHESLVEYTSETLPTESIGECVLLIGPVDVRTEGGGVDSAVAETIVGYLTNTVGVSDDDAVRAIAGLFRSKPQAVRKVLKKARILAKRQNHNGD